MQLGLMNDHAVLSPNSSERMLLFDLWKILGVDESELVYSDNLKVLIEVILRIIDGSRVIANNKSPPPKLDERAPEPQPNAMQIGFFNEKEQFCLRHQDVPWVQAHFKAYYLNRLQFHKVKQQQRIEEKREKDFAEKNTFKPKLAASK